MAQRTEKFFIEEDDFMLAVATLSSTESVGEAHEIVAWMSGVVRVGCAA